MKLEKSEVEHIAQLARLGLSEEEKEIFADQLGDILEYVGQLKEVDTSGVEPIAQITGLESVLREDVVESCDSETRDKLLEELPAREDDLAKAGAVFE